MNTPGACNVGASMKTPKTACDGSGVAGYRKDILPSFQTHGGCRGGSVECPLCHGRVGVLPSGKIKRHPAVAEPAPPLETS